MSQPINFVIKIDAGQDSTNIELDELSRNLLNEIKEIEVESAKTADGDTLPDQAKGDPITIGALAIAVLPTLLPSVILLIQNWLLRQQNQNIKVKLGDNELEIPRNMPKEGVQEIIDILNSNTKKTKKKKTSKKNA